MTEYRPFKIGDRVINLKPNTAPPVGSLGTVVPGPACSYGVTVHWDEVGPNLTNWRPYWSTNELEHAPMEYAPWTAPPQNALWYGEVVVCFSEEDGDTDYFYGYSADDEAPDVELLVPEGWALIESLVAPTPLNPAWVPIPAL